MTREDVLEKPHFCHSYLFCWTESFYLRSVGGKKNWHAQLSPPEEEENHLPAQRLYLWKVDMHLSRPELWQFLGLPSTKSQNPERPQLPVPLCAWLGQAQSPQGSRWGHDAQLHFSPSSSAGRNLQINWLIRAKWIKFVTAPAEMEIMKLLF